MSTSSQQLGRGRAGTDVPRIESLRVENYRALRQVEFDKLTPMTVLLGPNGSGKSTVFDVFNFLSECFQFGLRHAWDRRGRGKELKTRGSSGPIVFDLKYREHRDMPVITYHLAIDEGNKGPEVVEEWLQWRRGPRGIPTAVRRTPPRGGPSSAMEIRRVWLPRRGYRRKYCRGSHGNNRSAPAQPATCAAGWGWAHPFAGCSTAYRQRG